MPPSRGINLTIPLVKQRFHQLFLSDDLSVFVSKNRSPVDVAIVIMGVDDCLDGFFVKYIIELSIKGGFDNLSRGNAFSRIYDDQAIVSLNQRWIVPIVTSSHIDPICNLDHSWRKEFLILFLEYRIDWNIFGYQLMRGR